MPNTFGAPYVLGVSPAQAYRLVDPREARASRQRFRRDLVQELELANSFYVPAGRDRARGFILLHRKDYDLLKANNGLYGTNYQLELDQFDAAAPKILLSNLAIVQARCVTTGLAADPNALYLVEITDARGVLSAPWFQAPAVAYYNVPAPAYPDTWYDGSLNVFNRWSWDDLVGDLWSRMTTLLGPYGGLPTTPSGFPDNWLFPGMSCWDALCDVLDHLGMIVAVDLAAPAGSIQYTVASQGGVDAAFSVLEARYATRVQDDYEWIDIGSGRVPGAVTVYFHRRNEMYGTEETVRADSWQWEMRPMHQVTVPAPGTFAAAAGTHYLWDDFSVRYDVDGNPLGADVAAAAAIATERAAQFFNAIYSGTLGSMRRVYAGLIPFAPGAQADGVCWRQDFRDEDRAGFITEVVRGEPLWPQIYG